jgi:hypothetical protein
MNTSPFEVRKSPTPELLQLLNNNIIGTPEQGMLYQHRGVHNKIDWIADPYYVNLIRNNKIAGTCCFCKRNTLNHDLGLTSFYIRYFTFLDSLRSRQGKKKTTTRKSFLREGIQSILSGEMLGMNANDKFFHYAYVDPRNSRSVVLCDEFGFEPVRQFTTILFNRIRPREYKGVKIQSITTSEQTEVRERIAMRYKEHTMFSWENLLGARTYYIIRNQHGEIMAGVQVNPELWKIISLPGAAGKIILNTFSHLPYLNRLFNKNYKFLTFEGIYYQAGAEDYLEMLFENLLSRYNMYSAIIPVDADSALYRTLRLLKLGWADKLSEEVRGNVICKFNNFSANDVLQFKKSPAYISGIDVT